MAKINQHLQDCIVRLLITDEKFLGLVRGQLSEEHFSSTYSAKIAELCFTYYDSFMDAPKDHLHDELVRALEDISDEQKELYTKYVLKILDMEQPNFDYVLSRINVFIKHREYENAAIEFADLITGNDYEQAQNLMYDALKSGIEQEEIGQYLAKDLTERIEARVKRKENEEDYVMKTGITALDHYVGGYKRGQLVCFLAPPKGMKSWSLVHVGTQAFLSGLKVVHISHENSMEETVDRYDMCITKSCNKFVGDTDSTYRLVKMNDDHFIESIEEVEVALPTILDATSLQAAFMALDRRKPCGEIIVKKYPMGQCTPAETERYLNYLETFENFIPDLIIIDYLDIMKPDKSREQVRHQLNDLWVWAKGLADSRNCLLVTASQTNRGAIRKPIVTMADFAEDIRKAANIDLGIAICQTTSDVKMGFARLVVIANRNGPMECLCHIQTHLDAGQFCTESWREWEFKGASLGEALAQMLENE